jgi:hypothetical protein
MRLIDLLTDSITTCQGDKQGINHGSVQDGIETIKACWMV